MVAYDFYQNTYLGSALSQTVFEKTVARAEAYIGKLERTYQVTPGCSDGRALAVCAVAEELAKQPDRSNISSASVGEVSIHYRDDGQKQLYRIACLYLDVHRGVC